MVETKSTEPRNDSFMGQRILNRMMARGTWIEGEEFAYPEGGFTRRARAVLRKNPNNPIELPYGELRTVRCSIPDTYFSIPARLRIKGRTVQGYLSIDTSGPSDADAFVTFTPEAR